jgi:hypothetical protein
VARTRRKFPGTKRYCGRGGEDERRSDASPWVVGDVLVGLVERLRRAAQEKKLVIEVATLAVATVAAVVGFDVIQSEKSAPAEIALLLREWQQRACDREKSHDNSPAGKWRVRPEAANKVVSPKMRRTMWTLGSVVPRSTQPLPEARSQSGSKLAEHSCHRTG